MHKQLYLVILCCGIGYISRAIQCQSSCDISTPHQEHGQEGNPCQESVGKSHGHGKSMGRVCKGQGGQKKVVDGSIVINEINKKIQAVQKELQNSIKKSMKNQKRVVLDLEYEKYLSQIAKLCEELLKINKKITVLGNQYTKRYADIYMATYLSLQGEYEAGQSGGNDDGSGSNPEDPGKDGKDQDGEDGDDDGQSGAIWNDIRGKDPNNVEEKILKLAGGEKI